MPLEEVIVERLYLLLPLLAAVLYVFASLGIKAADAGGMGTRRTIVLCNAAMAGGFLGFYDWSAFPAIAEPAWPVLAMGCLFAGGQGLTVLAFSRGEVSSVTPVFGVKVILVGLIVAVVLGEELSGTGWAAAVLAAVGVACVQVGDERADLRRNAGPVAIALMAACCFAAFDTMIQHWSPIVGFGRLLPPAMLVGAMLSLPLWIGTHRRGPDAGVPRATWGYMAIGGGLFALQGIVLMRSIGVYGDAAGANVAYASRGLWGVVLVWAIGHWFNNRELAARSRRVMAMRIVGAATIMTAIGLEML